MTGVAGTIHSPNTNLDRAVERLAWTGDEDVTTRTVSDVTVTTAFHPRWAEEQPARTEDGTSLWVWGVPRGVHGPTGYEPRDRPPQAASARYCATLYDRFGLSFVRRLNGSAVGVVREADGRCHLFTDRLGTRPVYYWRGDDGLAFATSIQALAAHPAVAPTFDVEALAEYFALRYVPGTRTPIVGVENLPPATVATVGADGTLDQRRYWTPKVTPDRCSFGTHVERFRRTLQTVLEEQIHDVPEYGLLLSGGSDSRLLLNHLDDATAYHMMDWLSREARTALNSANTAGSSHELLTRDTDYQRKALERNPKMMNFSGTFDQAHASGFLDAFDDVDVLVSGLYSDVLFKGHTLEEHTVSLGPLGTLHLPIENRVGDLEEFVTAQVETPDYLRWDATVSDTLRRGLRRTDGEIDYQGVGYPSLRELVSYGEFYPLTNDPDLFYYGLLQSVPHYTPFLDNRLVNLALRIPVNQKLRDNVVHGALRHQAPKLAAIPHPKSGVPPAKSFPSNFLAKNLVGLRRRWGATETPPADHLGQGPWMDDAAVIRNQEFVMDALVDNRARIQRFPFLDWSGTVQCYNAHLAGADNSDELYALLSFLEMPLVRDVLDATDDRAAAVSAAIGRVGGDAR